MNWTDLSGKAGQALLLHQHLVLGLDRFLDISSEASWSQQQINLSSNNPALLSPSSVYTIYTGDKSNTHILVVYVVYALQAVDESSSWSKPFKQWTEAVPGIGGGSTDLVDIVGIGVTLSRTSNVCEAELGSGICTAPVQAGPDNGKDRTHLTEL